VRALAIAAVFIAVYVEVMLLFLYLTH